MKIPWQYRKLRKRIPGREPDHTYQCGTASPTKIWFEEMLILTYRDIPFKLKENEQGRVFIFDPQKIQGLSGTTVIYIDREGQEAYNVWKAEAILMGSYDERKTSP